MQLFKTKKAENAVDEVVFALVFLHEFDDSTIQSFTEKLPSELKESFPHSNKTNRISLNVDLSSLSTTESTVGGIALRNSESVDTSTWQIRAESNNIIIACRDYTRWDEIWNKAYDTFVKVLKLIKPLDNPLSEIVFQCSDIFFEEDLAQYSIENVFTKQSKYLSSHVLDAGYLWHIHQGWYEKLEGNNLLNVLNISSQTIELGKVQASNIMHLLKLQLNPQMNGFDGFYLDSQDIELRKSTFLFNVIDEMHNKNKDVLRSLLNDTALIAIGLKSL